VVDDDDGVVSHPTRNSEDQKNRKKKKKKRKKKFTDHSPFPLPIISLSHYPTPSTSNKHTMNIFQLFFLFQLLCVIHAHSAHSETVTIEGRAWGYGFGGAVHNANVTVLNQPERGWQITDHEGYFKFNAQVGEVLTFVMHKKGYTTVQSATVTVPEGGMVGEHKMLTFQSPPDWMFDVFAWATGSKLNDSKCHMVVTVTGYNMTLHNDPQGEPNATVKLTPPCPTAKPFYFGVWHKLTDPFSRGLTSTSADGGVLWANVDPIDVPYVITAHKPGYTFSNTTLICTPGKQYLVNGSPPQGPIVLWPPPGLVTED
jgi:hypothetical protein